MKPKKKRYLDRGWPYGLERTDKKRSKSHNTTPKKFQHKNKEEEEPQIEKLPNVDETFGNMMAGIRPGVIKPSDELFQGLIMDKIMEEEE